MGTALTINSGSPFNGVQAGIGGAFSGIFSLLCDTTDENGEMTVDLTDHFSEVWGGVVIGNDTVADNAYKISVRVPTKGTAASATNTLLNFHYVPAATGDAAAAAALAIVESTDLSAIGDLRVMFFGKR